MFALLSLLLGSRARTLTADELARCVVRRGHSELALAIAIPRIIPTLHRQVLDNPRIVQELMDLPPAPSSSGRWTWRGADRARARASVGVKRVGHCVKQFGGVIAKASALAASVRIRTLPDGARAADWICQRRRACSSIPGIAVVTSKEPGTADCVRSHLTPSGNFTRGTGWRHVSTPSAPIILIGDPRRASGSQDRGVRPVR